MISLLAKQLLSDAFQHLPPLSPQTSEQWRDIQATLQKQLEAGLKKANIVSRTEFDAQVEMLQRVQQELGTLQERYTALEKSISQT
jgi:BMFP domain-containing protein YqiC